MVLSLRTPARPRHPSMKSNPFVVEAMMVAIALLLTLSPRAASAQPAPEAQTLIAQVEGP